MINELKSLKFYCTCTFRTVQEELLHLAFAQAFALECALELVFRPEILKLYVNVFKDLYIGLDKNGYQVNIFVISP